MWIRVATLVRRALAEVCTVAVLIVITITNTNISEAQNVAIMADLVSRDCNILGHASDLEVKCSDIDVLLVTNVLCMISTPIGPTAGWIGFVTVQSPVCESL